VSYVSNRCFQNNISPSAFSLYTWFAMVPNTAKALREQLKAAGGRWDPEEKFWRVSFGAIRGDSTLLERIVRE